MSNKIEPVVLSEDAVNTVPTEADPTALLVHFKLVGMGPESQRTVARGPKIAKRLMAEQPNHYLYASKEDVRSALHHLVDMFCDRQGI